MATIIEIKKDLSFTGKLSFFNVLNKDKEESCWWRAINPFTGDFLVAHEEVLEGINEDPEQDNLFLKRSQDAIFEDNILHRVFILCRGKREAGYSF